VEPTEKTNRGRSAEARDPNRPVDPLTGEKEGLGPRADEAEDEVDVVEDTEVPSE